MDSSGTLGTGILKGTTHFFGDYDECLGINDNTNGNHIHIVGQYCTLQISIRHIIGNVPVRITYSYDYQCNKITILLKF